LRSLAGSDDDDEGNKRKRYRKFHGPQDLKVPIELECEMLFTNSCAFKRALKNFAVHNGFDFLYKHYDKGWVSAIWKIHAC
jgi:hypothetical protein